MSHHFDCVVDTREMAHSIHSVNRKIDETTGAVVAMKVAVVAAEKEGADHVCKNVNRGFYSLIHSQISQKMAALKSKVDAQFMRLNQQKKQLIGIRSRMERDYIMICARYGKLFTALNRALKQRVTELDRPVMDLVNVEATKITNRQNLLMADVPVGQEETIKASQRIASSKLKHRAVNSISAITRFIADSNRLERITNSILLRKNIPVAEADIMVPVGIIESNFDNSGNNVTQLYVSQMGISDQAQNVIENRISSAMREDEFDWKDAEGASEVQNQFRLLVNSSALDERRKKAVIKLFERNRYQTL